MVASFFYCHYNGNQGIDRKERDHEFSPVV